MSGRLPECDFNDSVAGWSRPIQRRRAQQAASHTKQNYVCPFFSFLFFGGGAGGGGQREGGGVLVALLIKSCPVAHYNEVVLRSILILFISICSGLGLPLTSHFSAFFPLEKAVSITLSAVSSLARK